MRPSSAFNQVACEARLFTPADRAIVTPNADTPYCMFWMDLRAEPLVLSVPEMESERFYHFQLIDWYTHNFAYVGTLTTGHDAGSFLIAGPGWEGERPDVIDDREYETDFPGFGRTFPHPYGEADDKYFTTRLTLSPAGDELTLNFAKALLDNEGLGADEVPDYLAVSFSSTDYVGHVFGASSLESEDNLARLDRTLAALFAHVDEKVGLDNTLIVLSADHGQPEVPGRLHELGIGHARHFDTDALDKAPAIAALKVQFGLGEELIEAYNQPYLYLNRELIRAKGLAPSPQFELTEKMDRAMRKQVSRILTAQRHPAYDGAWRLEHHGGGATGSGRRGQAARRRGILESNGRGPGGRRAHAPQRPRRCPLDFEAQVGLDKGARESSLRAPLRPKLQPIEGGTHASADRHSP